jgi:hypothetical protein
VKRRTSSVDRFGIATPSHLTPRYVITEANGTKTTGVVQGNGGAIVSFGRLEAAVRNATRGRDTGCYEPKPGCVVVYPDFCSRENGRAVVVSLVDAHVEDADDRRINRAMATSALRRVVRHVRHARLAEARGDVVEAKVAWLSAFESASWRCAAEEL